MRSPRRGGGGGRLTVLALSPLLLLLFPTITTHLLVSGFSVPSLHRSSSYYSFLARKVVTITPSPTSTTTTSSSRTANQRSSLLFMDAPSSPGYNPKNDDATAPPDDEQEWKALLEALKMYKAAYGDLKVPQRFVVPNLKPWPNSAWGLKLGRQVASIRATGKYIEQAPQLRTKQLDQLGFVWRVRQKKLDFTSISQEQIYEAMKVYKQLFPNEELPHDFVVPRQAPWPETVQGMPLGHAFPNLATEAMKQEFQTTAPTTYGQASSSQPDSLSSSSNQSLSANDVRFQKVYLALQTYVQVYGDLLVPQPFTVPKSTEWPEETWGLRLGARVNAIRSQGTFINTNPDRKQMLDDLGFVWSPPKQRRRKRTEEDETTDNFDTESSREEGEDDSGDDTDLSVTPFDVFFENEDSEAGGPAWGLEAGREAPEPEQSTEEEFLPPRTLDESLEEATIRAKEVGIVEAITANRRVVKGKRPKDIPWFNDDFGEDFVFGDVLEALTFYKELYGDWNMEEDFVVPTPKEVSGFLDDDIDLNTFDPSERAALAIQEFEDDDDDDDDDAAAAEIRRLEEEVSQVATKQRPSVLEEWPEHLAGMQLGNIVTRIRDGSLEVRHIPERKKQLDDLDFDWGDPAYFIDVPFEKAMCAMYAYYLVRGDTFIDEDFVMPAEDPWPRSLAGYDIGSDVKRIRELQNFFEAYHPEKVSLLRMIDFAWFPIMALPLDPNEAEETAESLLLTALGHPDYAKMIDIPMGLPDKLMADGPFYEADDPKRWWKKYHNWEYVKDYWYQQGRRDNAFALRQMGYPQMADEHEAKYGPGLFSQMEETMRIFDESDHADRSLEEQKDLLEKLNYFRGEMLGCTDVPPSQRDEILLDLDAKMLEIMKETNLELDYDDSELDENLDEISAEEADVDAIDLDDQEFDDIEIDVEGVLGLDHDERWL